MVEAIIVGLGAGLGAGLRSLLDISPWAIVGINVLGSFLMGFARPRPFWGTGFLGGFTSYSAYALTVNQGLIGVAIATVVGCVGAYLVGSMRWRS